jgi:hypothetical protein
MHGVDFGAALKLLVAIAAGIVAIAGAFKVLAGIVTWWRRRREASHVSELLRTPHLGLQLWQDGREVPLRLQTNDGKDIVEATLGRSPFEIWFPRLGGDNAFQVCTWWDESIFRLPEQGTVEDTPMFAAGHGAADFEYGGGALFVAKDANAYLTGTRMARASDDMDKFYVSTVRESEPIPISKLRRTLFLLVYLDRAGNGVLTPGNLEFMVVKFR